MVYSQAACPASGGLLAAPWPILCFSSQSRSQAAQAASRLGGLASSQLTAARARGEGDLGAEEPLPGADRPGGRVLRAGAEGHDSPRCGGAISGLHVADVLLRAGHRWLLPGGQAMSPPPWRDRAGGPAPPRYALVIR
jgi:hypothetical protein